MVARLTAFLKQSINIGYDEEGRSEGLGQKHFKNIFKKLSQSFPL
jgi:hypothetical protein